MAAIRMILLLYCYGLIKAADKATFILPQGTVPVCAGDPLLLECTIAGNLLEWRINIMLENETRVDLYTYQRLIHVSDLMPESIRVNSIVFKFTTSAPLQTSPLMSTLNVKNVTTDLSGTEVICVDRISRQNSSSAVIKVINYSDEHKLQKPQIVNLTIRIMHQDNNGIDIAIHLHWNKSADQYLFHYYINVFPNQMHDLLTTKATCIEARVLYDTLYNVSIVAVPRCGHHQNSTALQIGLFYSDCGMRGSSNENITYLYEGMKGSTIRNQCSGNTRYPTNGVDQNTPTNCGPPPPPQNGHIISYSSTLEGAEVTYVCWNVHHEENTSQCVEIYTIAVCNVEGKWESRSDDMCSIFAGSSFEVRSQQGKIAVASSVTVFVVTSILFFIIGFLSRHLCHKERKTAGTASPIEQPQIPYYDDVVLKQQEEQELELKDNVAYAWPVNK